MQVAVGKSLKIWIVTITGAKGTVFEGEKFKLRLVEFALPSMLLD
jgi:ubiquitin-protein ligase